MVHTQEGIESAIGAWDGALASYFWSQDLALDRKDGRSNNADQIRRFRELLGLFLANADPTIWLVSDVPSQVRGFYPISTDGLKRAENFKSCRATLRRIRGL